MIFIIVLADLITRFKDWYLRFSDCILTEFFALDFNLNHFIKSIIKLPNYLILAIIIITTTTTNLRINWSLILIIIIIIIITATKVIIKKRFIAIIIGSVISEEVNYSILLVCCF
jgi:hypothetical protein